MEINLEKNKSPLGVDQELLGLFDNISYSENQPSKKTPQEQKVIDAFWEQYHQENPSSTRDPKMRIEALEFSGSTLKVFLSRGIDFADIMYTNLTYTKKNDPPTPQKTYEITGNIWKTHDRFANAASVGAIIEFIDEPEPVFIFNIRSSKQATEPTTVSLLVNGYVDVMEQSLNLLLDNLYKETEEEARIKSQETRRIKFIGPAQMRGKGCDLIWLVQPDITLKEWVLRWQKSMATNESAGIIICKRSELDSLFSRETKKILPHIISDNQTIKIIEKNGFTLNPLLRSLENVIKKLQ